MPVMESTVTAETPLMKSAEIAVCTNVSVAWSDELEDSS